MDIRVFKQNSILITTNEGKKIYIDPFQIVEATNDADYIFITHDHYDHYSPEDINKVKNDTTVMVVPEKMYKKASKEIKAETFLVVQQTEKCETKDFKFETVPAYNILMKFHLKSAGWVGYIFEIDGKRIYVAGDTDATKEAKEVKCDIALVPVGGTFTMNPQKAAEFINLIKPETAIPVHYGEVVGSPEDGSTFASLVDSSINVEIKM